MGKMDQEKYKKMRKRIKYFYRLDKIIILENYKRKCGTSGVVVMSKGQLIYGIMEAEFGSEALERFYRNE